MPGTYFSHQGPGRENEGNAHLLSNKRNEPENTGLKGKRPKWWNLVSLRKLVFCFPSTARQLTLTALIKVDWLWNNAQPIFLQCTWTWGWIRRREHIYSMYVRVCACVGMYSGVCVCVCVCVFDCLLGEKLTNKRSRFLTAWQENIMNMVGT